MAGGRDVLQAPPYVRTGAGVRLAVHLTPGAGRSEIVGLAHDARNRGVVRARVSVPPEAGKANRALLKLLARTLRLPATSMAITTGAKGRRKTVMIAGDTDALAARIDTWLGELT